MGFYSILNDGNTRGKKVYRAASNAKGGFSDECKSYNCFGFKVVVGINAEKIQETVTSRSIVVQLCRKARTQGVRIKFKQFDSEFASLRSRFYTLSLRYGDEVRELTDSGTIKFPLEFTDRQVDAYEPLWAMLNCMANKKAQEVCKKACRLCTEQSAVSSDKALLRDIFRIVKSIQQESIKTLDLLDQLHLIPEWQDLSSKKIGKILDAFQVKSHHIWKENNARGYFVNQLKRAYYENK